MLKILKKVLPATFIIGIISSFAACKKETLNLALAEIHLDGYPTSLADREFARLVEKKTNGNIHIEVYTGGTLYQDETDSINAIIDGKVDFARVSTAPLSNFVPEINLVNLPYLFRDREHMWKVLDSSFGDKILSNIEEFCPALVGICYYDSDCRSFYTTKPIKSIEDMKGLKIRMMNSELMKDIVNYLGGTGVSGIPTSEVYSAIQNGIVDGAENNWSTYENMGDFLVAPYYTLDRHTWIPEVLLASSATFAKLSEKDVEIIKSCAKEVQKYEIQKNIEKQEFAEEKVRKAGTTVIELSPQEIQKFKDATAPIYDKYASGYKDVIKEIMEM